jgi:hypothetical protein
MFTIFSSGSGSWHKFLVAYFLHFGLKVLFNFEWTVVF